MRSKEPTRELEAYQGAKESTSDAGALLCIYCGRKKKTCGRSVSV